MINTSKKVFFTLSLLLLIPTLSHADSWLECNRTFAKDFATQVIQAAQAHQFSPSTHLKDFQELELNGRHVFIIEKRSLQSLDYKELRRGLLGLTGKTGDVVQVVGDSKPVSTEGSVEMERFAKIPFEAPNDVVLFGTTGRAVNSTSFGVNESVILAAKSDEKLFLSLVGNLVEKQVSWMAEGKIHCAPEVKNYLLVMNSLDDPFGPNQADFGSDAPLSDLTTDHGYVLLGGPQTFFQVANLLENNSDLTFLFGRKIRENADRNFLSAAEFIWLAQEMQIWKMSPEEASRVTDAIITVKPLWPAASTQIDAASKAELIKGFKNKWIGNGVYTKVGSSNLKIQFHFVSEADDLEDLHHTLNRVEKSLALSAG